MASVFQKGPKKPTRPRRRLVLWVTLELSVSVAKALPHVSPPHPRASPYTRQGTALSELSGMADKYPVNQAWRIHASPINHLNALLTKVWSNNRWIFPFSFSEGSFRRLQEQFGVGGRAFCPTLSCLVARAFKTGQKSLWSWILEGLTQSQLFCLEIPSS